jgi:hypothetical protein
VKTIFVIPSAIFSNSMILRLELELLSEIFIFDAPESVS